MTATLMVRAQVREEDREAFDGWYRDEHLPDAMKAFDARTAWRGWSDAEPGVHYAFYEFDTLARAREVMASSAVRDLIAEFDRCWEDRVTRSREVIEACQRLGPATR